MVTFYKSESSISLNISSSARSGTLIRAIKTKKTQKARIFESCQFLFIHQIVSERDNKARDYLRAI